MAGALRRRKSDDEAARNFALMNAYFGGILPNAAYPRKLPPFNEWLARMTGKRRQLSREEVMARLDAMAARGLVSRH
jgi:hypothetical protein